MSHPDFKISDEELEVLIHKYCNDFTQGAQENLYDPIFGRDAEILNAILILLQKGRKNVLLQAPAGVGKTALCVGLAQSIVQGGVPDLLKDARVLEVDLASMAAGTTGPAEMQGRFVPFLKGIAERYRYRDLYPRTILFFDEIHQIMPTCEGSAYKGLSEVMKPYLTSGDIYVVGATTVDEYRQYIALDPAMDRRFQQVYLDIPDDAGTVRILEAIKKGYEKHHNISVSPEICALIVDLTSKHMRKRNQPDKAITTMDGACAYEVLQNGTGRALSAESVKHVVSVETGINANAL